MLKTRRRRGKKDTKILKSLASAFVLSSSSLMFHFVEYDTIYNRIQPLAIELKICLEAMFVNFLSNETNLYVESDLHLSSSELVRKFCLKARENNEDKIEQRNSRASTKLTFSSSKGKEWEFLLP